MLEKVSVSFFRSNVKGKRAFHILAMMFHAKMLCKIALHKFPFCFFFAFEIVSWIWFWVCFWIFDGEHNHTKGSKAPIFPATFQVRRRLWRNGRSMLPLRLARCVGRLKPCKLSFFPLAKMVRWCYVFDGTVYLWKKSDCLIRLEGQNVSTISFCDEIKGIKAM